MISKCNFAVFVATLFMTALGFAQAQTNTFPTTGNVGIGTTAPNSSLEVLGNLVVDGADNPLTSTQVNAGGWAWNGLVVGSTNSIKYSGIAVGGALRFQGGPYNGFISFHNFGVNLPLRQSMGAQIGAVPDDAVGADIGMSLQFNTLQSGVNVLSERMRISNNGNVGIGTTVPGAKLEVNGNVRLTSGGGGSITFQDGSVQSTAWTGVLCGGDYAESVSVSGERARYEPGDVLVIDQQNFDGFAKSAQPYSTGVAGVYSTKPGVIGRKSTDPEKTKAEIPMAMVGIAPTKVSAENGSIKRGDLLVTSATVGYAMKGADRSRTSGAIVGKALGSLSSGTGVIDVLVTLQ